MPENSPKYPTSVMNKFMGNRSVFAWVFGSFFRRPANTSGLLAIILIASCLWLHLKLGAVPDWLRDAVFIVIGFYFGGIGHQKPEPDSDTD